MVGVRFHRRYRESGQSRALLHIDVRGWFLEALVWWLVYRSQAFFKGLPAVSDLSVSNHSCLSDKFFAPLLQSSFLMCSKSSSFG
jgi:hypothetical protein